MTKPAILLIGGLDPQGCAGMTSDIQTVTMHQCHPVPLLTCLTEQTQTGMHNLGALDATQFMAQYDSCTADQSIQAIKIGLIPSLAIAQCIYTIVQQHTVPVILDPVLSATSGGVGVDAETQAFIANQLLPLITILTPNLDELHCLSSQQVETVAQWPQAAKTLLAKGLQSCLVKGGHHTSDKAIDVYVDKQHEFYCYQTKLTGSVRGTGCVLASSLACHLALGEDPREAVVLAKIYLSYGFRHATSQGAYRVFYHHEQQMAFQDIPKLCYQAALIEQTVAFPACPERLGIYPVVDNSQWVKKLIAEGVTTLQLRMKSLSQQQRHDEIKKALSYCDASVAFFVNDYWQQAIELGAYGVHLGQEDLDDASLAEIADAGLRLGVSTHAYWELARALAINPSYIALGPIYETTSKAMPFSPQGLERLKKWTALLDGHYPLVAIGGIDIERAKQVKATGVGSAAMISAITKATDYQHATQSLLTLWAD